MMRRFQRPFARSRPPRSTDQPPRPTSTPHLVEKVLTIGLIVGLIGTLVLTFSVALSASSARGTDSTPESPAIDAPTGNQPDSALSPIPIEETGDAAATPADGAAPSTDDGEDADTEVPADADEDVAEASGITAQAAFALDVKSGKSLSALNADERRPMASLTKMVTALVVAKAIKDDLVTLDDAVEIEESDVVDPMIYSHMGLVAGDTVTIEQLLEGMLIPSGNDAAKALARYVGERLPDAETSGPRAAFLAAMNKTVKDLKLNDTKFENPDGDDDQGNYSTAHDLAFIGRAVMKSKLLADIVATPQVTLTSAGLEQRQYDLYNTNHLLGQPGVTGVKTGTTVGAGACLVASATLENGRQVIVVVLGSELDPTDLAGDPLDWPRFADARTLFSQVADAE